MEVVALVVAAATYTLPPAAHGIIPAARATVVCMASAEDEARQRWLAQRAQQSGGAFSSPRAMSQEEAYAMQKAARARAREQMEGGPVNHEASSSFGAAFGHGVDEEDYGYGAAAEERALQRQRAAEQAEEEENSFAPAWLTDDPMGARDRQMAMQRGFFAGESSATGGFDGRQAGWQRKVEQSDPNPPPMANTLKGPKAGAQAAQAYVFDSDAARENLRQLQECDAQEEEAELLAALTGDEDETEVPKGAYDNTEFW